MVLQHKKAHNLLTDYGLKWYSYYNYAVGFYFLICYDTYDSITIRYQSVDYLNIKI